jgi:pantoate--beta-alanine ligase
MQIAKTIKSIRQLIANARAQGKSIALVPTMGFLHAGHISLIDAAVKQCDFVVVSIFVNPTQFGPNEDLDKYPRDLETDVKICESANAAAIFAPTVNEIYTEKNITWVTVDKLTENLCGKSRPIHFRGVTTVCAKLFNIVTPDKAFFGQKDAQQAIVIKRMARDLNFPLEIVICPTVREPDGLAMSSRNKFLTQDQRKDALLIYKALQQCEKMVSSREHNCQNLIRQMRKILELSPQLDVEYISIVDPLTVRDIEEIADNALVAIAAKIGETRLIDNIIVHLHK